MSASKEHLRRNARASSKRGTSASVYNKASIFHICFFYSAPWWNERSPARGQALWQASLGQRNWIENSITFTSVRSFCWKIVIKTIRGYLQWVPLVSGEVYSRKSASSCRDQASCTVLNVSLAKDRKTHYWLTEEFLFNNRFAIGTVS